MDVPGLYKSIFADGGNLTCPASQVKAYAGCTIGGTSAINAGLFFEPPASDWDLYFPAEVSDEIDDVSPFNAYSSVMLY